MLHRIKRTTSIRSRLSLVFLFLLLVVIFVGFESLNGLHSVNEAAAEIRLRWLPGTHALGDLNNFTTDFPPAEAARWRAQSPSEQATIDRQMNSLDRGISSAQRNYTRVRHDSTEDELYRRFADQWNTYRRLVERSRSIPGSGDGQALRGPLLQEMNDAYGAASSTLDELTDLNARGERDASARSDLSYDLARRHIAVMLIFAGLLVAAATAYVTRFISVPLVELSLRMHDLVANETRAEVRGVGRRDEIGEMARAVLVFRNNAVDLAQSRHVLTQQAAMLQERLAEEQRLMRLQRNFVSMASHEFGTPLAVIDGHAQRLDAMRDRLTADEIAERARKVRSAVSRLTQLINNLIGSARLIDGRIGLTFRPKQFDFANSIREACVLQRDLTPDAQIDDRDTLAPLMVYGDPGLLSQVIGNLLSNAVKYSPDNGLIVVRSARDQEQVVLAVEDHGIGVSEADRPRIFESYFRGANTSGIVGSGVGLYLVKAIAELHRGSIDLEPNDDGGSRFVLRIPCDPAVAAMPHIS